MVEFRHILCPVDFSDASLRALSYAAAVAGWYEAQLEVMHALPQFFGPAQAAPVAMGAGASDAALADLQRAVDTVGASRLAPALVVDDGPAHVAIARRAHAWPADLLVIGTHGRSGFNRLLLGSVTEKVLRAASCPVLTVPASAAPLTAAEVTFARIVCAIDYSPSALAALRYALELGRQANGCVTVINALEYMDPEEPCEHVDADIRARREHLLAHARDRLHTQLAPESTTWCDIIEQVVVDRAYKAVLREADASHADLIVMGAQGADGVELMLWGSNTQHVVRAARCPVLTVRA
jgi:nucleotide-binding universal stress UspA family protein